MRARYRLRQAANAVNGCTSPGIAVAGLGGARLHPAGDRRLAGSGYRRPLTAGTPGK